MDWETLRNIFLQYLEEQLQNWDKDFQSLFQEVLDRLKKEGYEITPEIEKQLQDFAVEKINQTQELIKQIAVITTGLSLKDPLVDDIVREVFNFRYPDGLNLSERLWDWSAELKHKLKEALKTTLIKGRSADAIMYELQDIINKHQGKNRAIVLKEKLPKWVKELEDIARTSLKDPKAKKEFEKKIKKFEKYVDRLSRQGSYYASKQLLKQIKKAVEEGKEYLIDKAIEYHIYHRQLNRLKTIARTEAANAYHKAVIKITEQDEDLIGYKWKLSKSHPKPDICDYLANVDYGYGKGIHPKNKVPRQKAHPNCMCYLIPVYKWEVEGKEKETPTVSKEVLERFAPKYIREFTSFGYNIDEFFKEKEKRFLRKDEALELFVKKYIGENRKVNVKIGSKVKVKDVPKSEKVIAIHKDKFKNEYFLTDYQVKHIYKDIDRKKKKRRYKEEYIYGLQNMQTILQAPDFISIDKKKEGSIYYIQEKNDIGIAVVVNKDTQNIRTIIVNKLDYFKKSDRFIVKEER